MKKIAVMILGLFLMQVAQAAVLNWGTSVLADSSPNGEYGYATPSIDLYLIYNGINNSDPTSYVDFDGFGNLVVYGGSIIAHYTSTDPDYWAGNFQRQETVTGLDWPADPVADWNAMNTKTFTIVAVSGDTGDLSTGGWYYGIYTGNAANFSNATGVNSIGVVHTPMLDAGQNWGSNLGGTVPLTVVSDHGSPTPSTGTEYYNIGGTISCSVVSPVTENGTNYACTGWTGTGSVPATGSSNNTGTFTINGYSSIIWHWAGEPAEYWLDVTVVGGGSLNLADGWHPAGTNLALAATPNAGWLFMGWSGDLTGDYTQTNTSLLMNAQKSVTATFSNDADGDGLTNTEEGSLGTDPRDSDSDDDGLLDAFEVYIRNTDPLDADTDDDMLYDGLEVSLYETDPLVFDSDGDGLGDGAEVLTYNTNPLIADSDGDGLIDGDEINVHSTDPNKSDTDDDLIPDGQEVALGLNPAVSNSGVDSDSDGLDDIAEVNSIGTDPLDADSDDDGLLDGTEVNTYATNPLDADSDDDFISDGQEVALGLNPLLSNAGQDSDLDGLADTAEVLSIGTNPLDADSDDDGLLDGEEVNTYFTNPLDADSDDDLIPDGQEVLIGFDPLTSNTGLDSDSDGLGDIAEVNSLGTNPLDADSDDDGLLDGDEINIYSTDPLVTDTDGDSLSDYEEVVTYNTNPNLTDSDADGLDDYAELNTHLTDPNDADSDDDGLSDGMEINTHLTDPNDADSDDDGLYDGLEINAYSTNPNLGDTSGDGIMDGYAVVKGLDPTVDQTGIYALLIINTVGFGNVTPDSDLYSYGTNLALEASGTNGMLFVSWSGSITGDYAAAMTNIILNGHMDITATFSDDADGDGVLNTNETALGTNPRESDSDSDGLDDYEELYTYSTDPLVRDMDGDGLSDGEEILTYNTDPNAVDTDLDGFSDGYEVSTGYDPALASSTPDLLIDILTAVEVRFSAASGTVYRIEGTDSLTHPWNTVESGIPGNGGFITRFYSILDQSNRFFRAKHD